MLTSLRRTDPDFFEFDWLPVVSASRRPSWNYTTTQVVRPTIGIGLYAECTTAGMTAESEPRWPITAGATVTDGSVVWTMKAPSGVTLPTITAAVYVITPTGITQSGAAISGRITTVKLDASSADLWVYTVRAEITAGGEDFSLQDQFIVVD